MIAAALAALRHLLIGGHVEIRDLWHDFGTGPGGVSGRVVAVNVSNNPAAMTALLDGMTDIEGPNEWKGSHHSYRDYRGFLLMMPVLVTELIDRVVPDTAAELPEQDVTRPLCFGVPEGYPTNCPRPAPHGPHPVDEPYAPPLPDGHAMMDRAIALVREHAPEVDPDPRHPGYIADADPRPLLELVLDERFGPARGPVAPIEIVGEPGQSVEQLMQRFGTVNGLVVVPGNEPVDDDGSVEAAWSRYARARAAHYFGDRRFPTMADARDALRYWPGFDMMTPDDRELVAASLVDPSMPDPSRLLADGPCVTDGSECPNHFGIVHPPSMEIGTDRRRFLVLPSKRRRRRGDASEVAV